jgi:hypothetical protein
MTNIFMPFKSQAQRKWMFANKPEVAKTVTEPQSIDLPVFY